MTNLFFSLIFVFFVSVCSAAEVTDLYQAQAPVDSQNEQDRLALAPELLNQVVIKVVGDRAAVKQKDISALVNDAENFIERYYYQQIPNPDPTRVEPQLILTLEFNASSINNALQRTGLPVWDKIRPESIIWFAADYDGNPQLLGGLDENGLLTQLEQAAAKRGIPLLIPLMDLEDQSQVTFNDVSTGNTTTIKLASERYGAPIIVTARLIDNQSSAEIHWQALFEEDVDSWSTKGTVQTAINEGVDELANRLGRRLNMALDSSEDTQLSIYITGVDDYEGYSRLMDYLKSLQAVSDIKVGSLGSEKLDLTLSIRGDANRFKKLLGMGGVVQPDNNDASSLQYRLMP